MPCERCKTRGVACGPKIWGEKAEKDLFGSRELRPHKAVLFLGHPLPKPDDSAITPLDDLYWQYFLFENFHGPGYTMRLRETDDTRYINIVPLSQLPRLAASDIFRSAAFAFASSILNAENATDHSLLYLDRCYSGLRKALYGPVSIEILYATYLLAKFSMRDSDPFRIWLH